MSRSAVLIACFALIGATGTALGQSRRPASPPSSRTPPSTSPGLPPSSGGPSPSVSPVTINPSPGGSSGRCFFPVLPPWYWGWPSSPIVVVPPPSPVWRIDPNGIPYVDEVTTPVFIGTPGGFPSMPLAQTSASRAADPLAFDPRPPRRPAAPVAAPGPRARPRDPERAKEMTELGDRLFRGDKLSLAVKRYEQAIKADPDRAEPRARLAQVAIMKGQYVEAANYLREAEAAEPGWLATAEDVQGLYREPGDFARQVAKLEAHLQTKPEDRDAWLVLGSLWYLSGRTQKAADVFVRLSDRKEDPALKAFLRAAKVD